MPQSLRRTWALLALALVAILPIAFVAMRDVARDVFPRCALSLVPIREPWTHRAVSDPTMNVPGVFLDKLVYERDGRVVSGSVEMVGQTTDGEPCACGTMTLRAAGITSSGVRVRPATSGDAFVVVDAKSGGDGIGEFRLVAGKRHLQIDRVVSRSHLPALVVWLAIGALGIAYLRARKGIAYSMSMYAWSEATLDAGGRVEGATGETLGVLESTGRRVFPGTVLVAPSVTDRVGALYRDVPLIARRNVAQGTHAIWRAFTQRGLRDAHALCVLSVACSLLALAARFLGA
ncbi:MAG TPA: hypothetical protein VIF62_13675 [Labilithrix sp.]